MNQLADVLRKRVSRSSNGRQLCTLDEECEMRT